MKLMPHACRLGLYRLLNILFNIYFDFNKTFLKFVPQNCNESNQDIL